MKREFFAEHYATEYGYDQEFDMDLLGLKTETSEPRKCFLRAFEKGWDVGAAYAADWIREKFNNEDLAKEFIEYMNR